MTPHRTFALRLASALTTLALTAAIAGCGLGTTSTASGPLKGEFQISGKVHGGEQPINGASIQIFAAGATGYGIGATSIMTSAVTTDTSGFFQLTGTYTCPTGNSLVYITATGGDPGLGISNPAIKLASAIGTCAQLQSASYVWINEVTTAATAFALAQYYGTTSGGFGAPNTTQAQLGLTNAIATVGNLVDSTTGNAITSATKGTALGGATITATPDATKLGTIANIIASCVNSDGGASSTCQTTLFPDVTPTGGTAPTDTLGAAVMMNTNPTSNNSNGSPANLTALFGLQSATSPFVGLSSQPADWTVGISYSAGTSTTQTLLNGANDIAVDSGGNVWIINYNSSATATESMAEFSPTGVPLANPFSSQATAPASMSGTGPRNMSIDTNNNVYAASSSSSGYVFEWNPTSSTGTSYAVGSQPYGIAIDGSNNVYVSHNSGTTYTLAEFPSTGGVSSVAATNRVEYPYSFLSQYMTVNSAGVPYLSNATSQTSVVAVTGTNPGTCTTYPCTPTNDTSLTATYTAAATGLSTPFGLAPAASGGVWATNSASTSVVYINGASSTSYGTSASFAAPRKVAVDGNNVAWVLNRTNGGVSEITTTGTILSPVPVSPATSPIGFVHTGTGAVTGIATDPSGNVWIANGAVGSATGGNSIFEIVGVAAPTVTPVSLAIKNSTVGVKP